MQCFYIEKNFGLLVLGKAIKFKIEAILENKEKIRD